MYTFLSLNLIFILSIILFIVGVKIAPTLFRFDYPFFIKCTKFFIFAAAGHTAVSLLSIYLFPPAAGVNGRFVVDVSEVFTVWWEDIFFVLPALLVYHFFGKKGLFIYSPFFLISTAYFAIGHLYQGLIGLIAFIYPFISLYYSSKKGISSMMAVHIMYDVIVTIYPVVFLFLARLIL